ASPSPPKPSRQLSRSSNSVALADSSAPAPRGVAGARRTYGGARSFKRDVEEERIFLSGATPARSLPAKDRKSSPASGGRKGLLPALPSKASERETYSALRAKWGVDEEEELTEEVAGTQLKSITQMRAKGENSRFVDEFEYLLEGLEPKMAIGVRRARYAFGIGGRYIPLLTLFHLPSAIEVLKKVGDPEFVRRLKSLGLVERVYTEFRKAECGSGDRVLDPALALILAIFAHDQRITEPLLRISTNEFSQDLQKDDDVYNSPICDVLVVLAAMLGRPWGGEVIGAAVVGRGVTKSDVRSVAKVRELTDSSKLLEEGGLPTTLRSLCLIAISRIACFAPRAIFRPQQLVCTSGALNSIVNTLVQASSGLAIRMQRYEGGLEFLPADGSINLPTIDTCLRVIEACSTGDSSPTDTHDVLSEHLAMLTAALCDIVLSGHIIASSQSPDPKVASAAMDCLLSSLRLLIELTNSSTAWSLALANCPFAISTLVKLLVASRSSAPPAAPRKRSLSSSSGVKLEDSSGGIMSEMDEPDSAAQIKFDVLCLSLGVLTNLAETVPDVKDVLRETYVNPSCRDHRKCARECHCEERENAIALLAALYLDPLKDSQNELNTSFVNGYSGMSLGLVMLDTPLNQSIVIKALADEPQAMTKLLSAMDEFAEMHDQAAREEHDTEMAETQCSQEMEANDVVDVGPRTSDIAVRIRRMAEAVRARVD
ncbi:hypothetical protein P7C70_g8379, partial [Phenoliferia sp. Uapishka_3]